MKLLFVYTNINGCDEDTYSFGLASLVSVCVRAGHKVKVVVVHDKGDYKIVYETFNEFNPHIVGFSSVSSQFYFVKEIAGKLKEINNSKIIVCGGVHPTIFPDCILEADGLDVVFIGESEESFIEFVQNVDNGNSYLSSNNIAYNDNGKVVRNLCRPMTKDLDTIPYPDREIVPFLETVEKIGYAPFHFSRGCPFPCTYCSNHAIAKSQGLKNSRARSPSPEYCICEIETTLDKFPSIDRIGIVDDIFGLNKRWRNEFLNLYVQRIKKPFFCLLRADVVNEQFVEKLKKAGCYMISFGIESGNEYIRNEVMKRDMAESKIIRAFDLCKTYNIKAGAINIIGVPGETEEMLWDTIRLNRKVKPVSSGINIFYPYRGTDLGDKCFHEKLVDIDKFNNFSNERRETVLNYDKEWRDKLTYYYNNWDYFVYRYNYKRRLRLFISRILRDFPMIRHFCHYLIRRIKI